MGINSQRSKGKKILEMKNSIEVNPDMIWDNFQDFYFEKETLVISMFYINPMLTKDQIKVELKRVFSDIEIRFEPWIDHYVWNESPVKFEMNEHEGIDYIYGEMVFGDYFTDEWLVTQILFDLSKTYEDLYIHLSDNEDEFLLIECAQHLPEWLEPENARNRDWINHGRVLIIPEEYYKDRGLKLTEALKFLDRAVYKCLKIEELDKSLLEKLKQYPTKALEGQTDLEITVPRRISGVLMKNKILNQAVLSFGRDINGKMQENVNSDDLVELKIRTTALAYLFIDYYLKSQNLTSLKIDGGKLVTQATELYIKENPDLITDYVPSDQEIFEFNEQGDLLQKELIRLMRIDKYVEPNITFEDLPSENSFEQDDDIIAKLENFFKDTNAGLDGVENFTKDGSSAPRAKIEEVESESNSEDEDEEARKYLKQEGVDIDEDDFFEYFTKEALKLSDQDLETFRNMKLDDEPGVQKTNEEDYEPDSEEEEMLKKMASGDVVESLQELLKSLETEGGMSGPAATLLQSMGMNIPKPKE